MPAAPSSSRTSGADAPDEPASAARPGIRVVRKPRRLPGDRGPAPKVALVWATFFGAGYAPLAPGTAGTAAAIPLWWGLSYVPGWLYLAVTAAVVLTGIAAAAQAGR